MLDSWFFTSGDQHGLAQGRVELADGERFGQQRLPLGHVAKRYYASGRTFSTQMLRQAFDNVLGEAKGLHSRYLPEMQARARTLDTAQIVDLVRRG